MNYLIKVLLCDIFSNKKDKAEYIACFGVNHSSAHIRLSTAAEVGYCIFAS